MTDKLDELDGKNLQGEYNQRACAKMAGPNSLRPTHTIYFVRDRGDAQKPFWDRIGTGWTSKDGRLSCKRDSLPVNGSFQFRRNEQLA